MFWTVIGALNEGFLQTLKLFLVTLVGALPLGLVIAFGSMNSSAPIRYLSRTLVWIIRGTPLMLQIIIIFYIPGYFFDGISIWPRGDAGRFTAASVAFIINYACYFSEIYRGGIQSVPVGQREAGLVLGLTKRQIFFKITLLQMVKRIIPPMSNEIITLVKDTSLARIIAIKEIIMVAQEYISSRALIWPLFYSGAFYLVFCGILTILLGVCERKLSYFKV